MVILRVALIAFTLLVAFGLRARAQSSDPSAAPSADPSERARTQFASGVERARLQQWKAAEDDFRASYALVPRPSTLYNLALVVFRQFRYQESAELCAQLLAGSDHTADATYRAHAEKLLARMREQGAAVEVLVVPEHAAWAVDGYDVPARGPRRQLLLAAGRHVLDFAADGHESRRVQLLVGEGDRHTLTVELSAVAAAVATPSNAASEPQPERFTPRAESARVQPDSIRAPPATSNRIPQWVLLGTGGALLAAAGVTGILALNADAEFEQKCPELRDCDPSLESLQDRTATLATATDVLLVSGGLAVGGALAWLLLTPEAPSTPGTRGTADVALTASGLSLRATF